LSTRSSSMRASYCTLMTTATAVPLPCTHSSSVPSTVPSSITPPSMTTPPSAPATSRTHDQQCALYPCRQTWRWRRPMTRHLQNRACEWSASLMAGAPGCR
jgi:hypothetical protein